ncbi:hypothetical protein [Streptomyces violaceoruber]|uniref:hypothetical protein n=1 Tax=Streptomyces violaceoruber TaxID=1935 RepID=UPI003B42D271
MTAVTVYAMPRDEVLSSLGPYWPPAPGATVVRIDPAAGVTDGTVTVYETPGRPGVSWWLADGLVPPQVAGAGGEVLAALIPGAAVEVVPDLAPESPPVDSSPLPTVIE